MVFYLFQWLLIRSWGFWFVPGAFDLFLGFWFVPVYFDWFLGLLIRSWGFWLVLGALGLFWGRLILPCGCRFVPGAFDSSQEFFYLFQWPLLCSRGFWFVPVAFDLFQWLFICSRALIVLRAFNSFLELLIRSSGFWFIPMSFDLLRVFFIRFGGWGGGLICSRGL